MTMAHSADFLKFLPSGSLTSESEYDMNYSDTEPTSSLRDNQPSRPTDYWFGKKYFECIIAQGVFEDTNNKDSIEDVDSKFEEVLRTYPYRDAVDQLRARISPPLSSGYPPRSASDYSMLMTFMGTTIRIGEQQDKRTMLEIVRRCQGREVVDSGRSPTRARSTGMRFKSESPKDDQMSHLEDIDGPSIDTFTSKLKEIGDKEGWKPDWKGGRYSKDPSLFQTTVAFSGYTIEGLPARNSRLAKHRASKAACDFLDQQRMHTKMTF